MKKDYFNGVVESLNSDFSKKKIHFDFVTLKSYEYWIRILHIVKNYPDPDDSIAIFPKENASRVLKDLSAYFEKINAEEDRMPKSQKEQYIQDSNAAYAGKRLRCDDDEKSVAYQRRQDVIVRFNDVIHREYSIQEISDFVQNYLNHEGIFDTPSQKVFYESIIRELMQTLKENQDIEDDGYFKRLNIVQKAFGLNDTEMELLMFSWIFFHKEQC